MTQHLGLIKQMLLSQRAQQGDEVRTVALLSFCAAGG